MKLKWWNWWCCHFVEVTAVEDRRLVEGKWKNFVDFHRNDGINHLIDQWEALWNSVQDFGFLLYSWRRSIAFPEVFVRKRYGGEKSNVQGLQRGKGREGERRCRRPSLLRPPSRRNSWGKMETTASKKTDSAPLSMRIPRYASYWCSLSLRFCVKYWMIFYMIFWFQAITLCPNVPVYWTNRALCHRKRKYVWSYWL